MKRNQAHGKLGESLAIRYLLDEGYDIIERNFRHRHAEIDIIAQKGEMLVFVEVRARQDNTYGYPEETISDKKIEKIMEGAEHYIFSKNWTKAIRFDIVSVDLGDETEIHHFKDAFY